MHFDVFPTSVGSGGPVPGVMDMFRNRMLFRGGEETVGLMRRMNGNHESTVLAWLSDTTEAAPSCGAFWPHGAASTSGFTSWTCTKTPLDFGSGLRNGEYAVVGAMAEGASAFAARLIFSNQVLRPGVLAAGTSTRPIDDMFGDGSPGVWGTFSSRVPPSADVLVGSGAKSSMTVALRVVRPSNSNENR